MLMMRACEPWGSLRTSWGGEVVTKRDSMVSLFSIVLLPSEVHFGLFLFKFLWARDGLDVKGAACSWGESNSHSQELKHRFLSKPGRDAAEQRPRSHVLYPPFWGGWLREHTTQTSRP